MAEKKPVEKKAGVGGFLKGLLFEEGPAKPSSGTPATASSPPPAPAPVVTGGAAPPAAAVDPKIRQLLEADVLEAAKPAFSEFQAIEASLRDVIGDERTRIKAALKTLTTRNQSIDAVLKDVDECIMALDGKEQEADAAAKAAIDERVGSRQAEVERHNADIEAKRNQIAELERGIARAEVERDRCQAAIEEERRDIDSKHRQFKQAIGSYRNDLAAMKQKLTLHGKGV